MGDGEQCLESERCFFLLSTFHYLLSLSQSTLLTGIRFSPAILGFPAPTVACRRGFPSSQ